MYVKLIIYIKLTMCETKTRANANEHKICSTTETDTEVVIKLTLYFQALIKKKR